MKRTPLRRRTPLKKKRSTKKATPKTQARLKKELDKWFSRYIRKIHKAECYTCGLRKSRKNLQCGHYISRQYLATRWDERNCRPQCVGCNIYGNGKPLDFEERLKAEYGADVIEDMKKLRHTIVKLTTQWYVEQIEKYKNLL